MGASATKEGAVVASDLSEQWLVVKAVAVVRIVQTDSGPYSGLVGFQFEEGGLVACADWVEVAGRDGRLLLVAAAEFDHAVAAHGVVVSRGAL